MIANFSGKFARLNVRANRATKAAIGREFCDWAIKTGRLVRDDAGLGYLVDDRAQVIPVADNSALRVALHDAGVNGSEPMFKWLLEDLQAAARNAAAVPIRRWATNDGLTVRISAGPNAYIETDGAGARRKANAEAGIYFDRYASLPGWDIAPAQNPFSLAALHPALQAPAEVPEYTPDVQDTLLMAWLCGLAAGVRPLPILAAIGGRGSGKSWLARGVLRLLLGPDANVTPVSKDERDFWTLAARRPVAGLDNLDSPDNMPWLCDALAAVATGAKKQGRQYYTNSDLAEEEADAAIILTSRTAIWARVDIAERTLPLYPREMLDSERRADSELAAELAAGRAGALTWLADTAQKLLTWLPQAPAALPVRFLDFGRLVWAYCAATGVPDLGAPTLAALRKAQNLAIGENDPLLAAILEYGPGLNLRGLIPAQVVKTLTSAGADIPFMNGGRAIGRKLRELRAVLLAAGWHMDETKQGNNTIFSLWQ